LYKQGLIEPFWDLEHRYLNYQREPFNCDDDLSRWRSQGYSQTHFTGAMYDMKNVMPKWCDRFFGLFQGINMGLSFYKMETCNILPYHKDTYSYYKNLFDIKNNLSIWRAIIFLEDWKPGHIFEIERTPITNWQAGEYVLWQYDTEHMAANLGIEPRYTVQLTFTDIKGDYIAE
jgi:hypothetical protein